MAKSLALLTRAFPTIQVDAEFIWEMLSDLPDQEVEMAVLEIVQTRADFYPSTNWVALIRSVATRCRRCNGRGRYVSASNYEIICDCVR